MNKAIPAGEFVFTRRLKVHGFKGNNPNAVLECGPHELMMYMYMGTVTAESLRHFVPDGVLMAMGYGPLPQSRAVKALADALEAARAQLALEPTQRTTDEVLAQADAALAGVAGFRNSVK